MCVHVNEKDLPRCNIQYHLRSEIIDGLVSPVDFFSLNIRSSMPGAHPWLLANSAQYIFGETKEATSKRLLIKHCRPGGRSHQFFNSFLDAGG